MDHVSCITSGPVLIITLYLETFVNKKWNVFRDCPEFNNSVSWNFVGKKWNSFECLNYGLLLLNQDQDKLQPRNQ